jgi:hypothetical protein
MIFFILIPLVLAFCFQISDCEDLTGLIASLESLKVLPFCQALFRFFVIDHGGILHLAIKVIPFTLYDLYLIVDKPNPLVFNNINYILQVSFKLNSYHFMHLSFDGCMLIGHLNTCECENIQQALYDVISYLKSVIKAIFARLFKE